MKLFTAINDNFMGEDKMSNPVRSKPLHLGHIISHPHFKQNMRKCVKDVVDLDAETLFAVGHTHKSGLIFTGVLEGERHYVRMVPFWSVDPPDIQAMDEIEILDGTKDNPAPLESEIGQGFVLKFHTHPSGSGNPYFSGGDLESAKEFFEEGFKAGLFTVDSVGSVYTDSYGQITLSVLFFQPRNLAQWSIVSENTSISEKECDWDDEDDAWEPDEKMREQILNLMRGKAMFLDFPVDNNYSIEVPDDAIARASSMIIFDR